MKKRSQLIVPVFIPHEGCPYRCAFCNQSKISGTQSKSDQEIVRNAIKEYLGALERNSLPDVREVAFYGGSFTGLEIERQKYLFDAVRPWIDSGHIHLIRVSTHSLLVNERNISFLKDNHVRIVELGIQSTNNRVLDAVGRPCGMETVKEAVNSIRKNGLGLGLQLMPGLPEDEESIFMQSVKDVIELEPDFVRIYPTLVIKNTQLYKMYEDGKYTPWSLDRMVGLVKEAMNEFKNANIPVIRVGLHADPSMLANLVAGPYHPSFRYLVDSLIARDKMTALIDRLETIPDNITFKVPSREVSLYLGHKKDNIRNLKNKFGIEKIVIDHTANQEELQLVA
ncbi:MAG: radical SAM protein [Nitrospinae bacterium]|nr:radical SAM protein [Nitrospinota bacterium]